MNLVTPLFVGTILAVGLSVARSARAAHLPKFSLCIGLTTVSGVIAFAAEEFAIASLLLFAAMWLIVACRRALISFAESQIRDADSTAAPMDQIAAQNSKPHERDDS